MTITLTATKVALYQVLLRDEKKYYILISFRQPNRENVPAYSKL